MPEKVLHEDPRDCESHEAESPGALIVPPSSETHELTQSAESSVIRNSKIMIVDDDAYNIMVVRKYLSDSGYENCVDTTDSVAAMMLIKKQRPALLLLDIMMPQVSGLDILRWLRSEETLQYMPVLILTAATDADTKQEALEIGATDFLTKPVDPADLVPRVRNSLITKAYQDQLAEHAEQLEQRVRQRTAELATSRLEVVHCLARAAEFRDDDTGHHVARVGRYAGLIARKLGFIESQVEMLELAAQLHDVGKIGVPDSILNHPGKLSPEQLAIMRKHCGAAKSILRPISGAEWDRLKSHARMGASILQVRSSPMLMLAATIAQTHHEWWDGTGYPLGLAGEDIPIEGRITAVADVYDALSSARPYKPAFPREKCLAIMREESGTHFDPNVLKVFFESGEEIVAIQMELMESD